MLLEANVPNTACAADYYLTGADSLVSPGSPLPIRTISDCKHLRSEASSDCGYRLHLGSGPQPLDGTGVTAPNEYDIICARGRQASKHPGNLIFRQLILSHLDRYVGAKSKLDKGMVIDEVFQIVYGSNGRFVKRDKRTGQWRYLCDVKAREKVTHAIRDAVIARDKASHRAKEGREQFWRVQEHLLTVQRDIFVKLVEEDERASRKSEELLTSWSAYMDRQMTSVPTDHHNM